MSKKAHKDIIEVVDKIAKLSGCNIQFNGSPCNTCFHSWASISGLSNNMAHLFWLILLGIRGDYSEEEIIRGIKETIKKN